MGLVLKSPGASTKISCNVKKNVCVLVCVFCILHVWDQRTTQVSVLVICLVREKAFLLFCSICQASWPQGFQACSCLHILSCCRDCCDHACTLTCLAFVWILWAQTEDLTLSLQVTYPESSPQLLLEHSKTACAKGLES